ncbi:uncharacterized protein LOC129303320 isoform X3 [Prosopis cineraria]|uniref:uncharacterized protein LOC129303320 isoform X3 n=1 Tax=Prosopis cineraria TaxID=364024 RepID=UPI002410A333|nr:uncharacterized protein LOC129303320 isoform X3 [Prosopis cineraria]
MLQWMGGSRRKVTTSRKSTQKRQKQYFEQRKRQQQNLQIMGSESSSDVLGISGQYLKEHRSLDILNLLNLSTNAQECYSPCVKDAEVNVSTMPSNILKNQPTVFTSMDTHLESSRIEEAIVGEPLGCQIDASQEKVLVCAPNYQNGGLNRIPCTSTNSKTMNDEYVGLSVIDLLYDDGPKIIVEEHPTFEDHVAFSLEGLGKVGAETPPHSPQQPNRISYGFSQLLKDEKKKKWSKAINHELEDLELEVDLMMKDINGASISNFSNLPYNKGKQGLVASQDYNHFNDQANKNGSFISQEFFCTSEIKDDIWNAPSSSFSDEKFDNEREYDTSWKKKTFQRGTSSPASLKSGVCKARYAFDSHLPKKRSLAAAFDGFDTIELPATYSKCQSENDYDFFVASGASRCCRSDANFHVQSLVPEDVRDNSSLLSEESCSSTAVRSEAITYSPSRLATGETSEEHKYTFGSAGNERRSNEGKCRSTSNLSKQRPSHYSNSILEEDICVHSGWQFEKRYSPVNMNSGDSSFCQNLGAKFAALGSNNGNEDPFGIFSIPESRKKASSSFSGLKSGAHACDSPPCCFTSAKFAFGESHVFSDVPSWSAGPDFPPKYQLKGNLKNVFSFHCGTPSPDLHENSVRDEDVELKMQQDCHGNSEIKKEIFLGKNRYFSEKERAGVTSTSNNHTQDCGVEKDPNLLITQSLETTKSLGHVEEMSSSLIKKPDKIETEVDNTKHNCDAETPLKYKIANEEKENWQPHERSLVARKYNKKGNNFSGQVTFESFVFQLVCVQKVLKGGSLTYT